MSHDLRTPLTTLLLYTEIVRDGRYDGQAQLQEYLAKIDTKARQIKQMSDNLFEYALVTRDAPADMDPPARFSRSLRRPLADMAEQLQQHGFACALRLGGEDVVLTGAGAVCAPGAGQHHLQPAQVRGPVPAGGSGLCAG